MPSNEETIWDNELIDNDPPVTKTVRLHCPSLLDKAELSFRFDVSNSPGCILDELKPIVINENLVPLQLPGEKIRLKLVTMYGIDVTKFVKASVGGEQNTITVNYRVRDKPYLWGKFGRRELGKLHLSFMLHWAGDESRRCAKNHEIPSGELECPICHPRDKWCMWHGEKVPANAVVCPFQEGREFINVYTPAHRKICPNCHKSIDKNEIYCEFCGIKQPLAARS